MAVILVCALSLGMCGYVVADASDAVPGWITLEPASYASAYPSVSEHQSEPANTAHSGILPDPAAAPVPDAAIVQNALNQLVRDVGAEARVGAVVTDAVTGETLAEINPATSLVPASNMKILTAYAALTELGPESTFSTKAMLSGVDLYLVGGGDILLAADTGDTNAINGRAGLGDLARASAEKLKASGISSVNVYVDTSAYSGPAYAPGVSTGNYKWVMQNAPIAVDRAQVEGSQLGEPASRALDDFVARLSEAGITATNSGNALAPKEAKELARVQSAPVRAVADMMLLESDNSLAENLAHQVALARGKEGSFAGGSEAMQEILAAADMPLDGAIIADGSGLSFDNRLTPQLLVSLLAKVWNCDTAKGCATTQIGTGMPLSGYDGTLKTRFQEEQMIARVHAKTGSLQNASSLSGFAYTIAGRPLIFSIIVNDLSPDLSGHYRPAIDKAVTTIAHS